MCEKFNSGRGCYICDTCRKTLWVGNEGATHPENRVFIYSTQPEDVVQTDKGFFCSEKCSLEYTEEL